MISAGRLQANTRYSTMPECSQTSCFDVEDNKSVPTRLTPIWDIILVTITTSFSVHEKCILFMHFLHKIHITFMHAYI